MRTRRSPSPSCWKYVLQNRFAMLSPAVVIDANFKAPTLWGATTTAFIGAEDVILCLGGVIVTFFQDSG